jgi:arabinose-5-phosphate isomerase
MKRAEAPAINIAEELGRVLDIEIEALQTVRQNLSSSFVKAVEIISACTGQVFVTGIGKSGNIGAKIAATLRSTGTPAVFIHAGEALHGDVGIIRQGDIVLAVGKSGETDDLNLLLRVIKKTGVPIVAITSNASSSMAQLSTVVIDLKISREACPLNLAPTASTTAALAVGDAIAVTLMKIKNISAEDYARHHPGGQLGKRLLLTVEDVMRGGDQNPIIAVTATVQEMLARITAFRVGAICVIDPDGKLLGLVTDHDVRKALEAGQGLFSMKISELMNSAPDVVSSTARATEALELMRSRTKPTAVLPVLDANGRVVGMVHLHDVVAAGI